MLVIIPWLYVERSKSRSDKDPTAQNPIEEIIIQCGAGPLLEAETLGQVMPIIWACNMRQSLLGQCPQRQLLPSPEKFGK